MSLKNKRVVVTGANSGIGLALVKLLIKENTGVVAADLSIDKLLAVKDVHPIICDVADPLQIDHLLATAKQKLGDVDIFIANAGFAYYEFNPSPDFLRTNRIFQVNVESIIYTAHRLKAEKKHHPFQMVAVSSAMAHWPLVGYAQYSATKAAVRAFGMAFRKELNKNQLFQLVYPIGTRTSFFKSAGNSPVSFITQTPEQVAGSIIKGIKIKSRNIYPSALFFGLLLLNRWVGFLKPLITLIETRRQ